MTALNQHIRKETLTNFVINLVLNAGIAYALFRGVEQIGPWGEQGYVMDLMITGLLLSAILGGIFIGMSRRKRDKGEFELLGDEGSALAWLIPYNAFLAAALLGILGMLLATPHLLGVLFLLELQSLTPIAYALIKGVWAGILASILVPIAIRQGLRQAS